MEAKSQTLSSTQVSGNVTQDSNTFQCPSCHLSLGSAKDVAAHYDIEIERLRQMQAVAVATKTAVPGQVGERRKPHNIFQRVQRNRQARLKQRTRKRFATPPAPAEPTCPICNRNFATSEIQRHAEKCLRKSNGCNGEDEHSSNDEDDNLGDDAYEEYEWAGQKRIRVSSLLEGGYASIGIGQSVSTCNGEDEDDEDLNVDEDDTQIYGPTQYNEADVIPTDTIENNNTTNNDANEEDVTSYMRSLITSGGAKSNIKETVSEEVKEKSSNDSTLNCQPCTSTAMSSTSSTSSTNQIIESLKARLRHYENHIPSKYKCLICLDDYRKPAISVACWHVHCEECWLRTLGTRKLCPQCNLITTPKDLRRIYL